MRNLVKISAIAFVALFAMAANASDIEFHGYARIGMGLNSQGGNAVCYHLMGADADYRLGNECDYVIEPNFDYKMAKLDDKSEWGVHVMPKVYKRCCRWTAATRTRWSCGSARRTSTAATSPSS